MDSSIALSWCFDDEASPETEALLDRVKDEGGLVPGLWHLEVANVLLAAERRGRTISGGISSRLEDMSRLPLATDGETAGRAWREIISLAKAEGLTEYDACYLELALRRGVPLATKDQALARAARRAGVPVLP